MQIAFLGTGTMGAPMVRRLLDAGHDVRAWNRTREKAEPLAGHGARLADDPAAAARGSEIIVTMLADGAATAEVARQALAAPAEDAVWWQCGTVGLEATEELAGLAAERGAAFLDGPVLGTRGPAQDGTLVVLAAGPEAARERCAPLFEAVAAKVVACGEEPGAGMRLKLVLNHWIGALTASLGDTVRLARALDVDPQVFLDTIAGGPLDAGYAQVKGGAMVAGEFTPVSFALRHAAKDVRLVLDAARQAGLELAIAPAVLARFAAAEERGHGDQDMAAVVLGAG